MNTRAFTLALIIAGFAMFLVHTYVEDQQAVFTKKFGTKITVVVASKDIKELELIDDSKIQVTSIPQSFASPGHFRKMKELENTMATVPILKGEQITKPRVTYPGANTGLARQVSVGKRAMAINITEKQAVSKLIKPGDRVDILASIDYASGRKDLQKVKTILQDILVLSTGKSMTNSIPLYGIKVPSAIKAMRVPTYVKYNTVALELDPFEVQKLTFLLSYSGIPPYLSLRNNNDKKRVRIKATKLYDILQEDAPEAKSFFDNKYKKQIGGR
ncbi:MAG: Flp pilus assembly protein CpaB [Halobacteriovoraceae bacterium]|nr:Flp pilus assembly protein CpaB [Halobacteriovoraceae bacterium]